MRKFAKIMAVLLALGFVASCGAKKKAVTKWSVTDEGGTVYFTFYNDGTGEMSSTFSDKVEVFPYTGDTRKSGSITIDGVTAEIRGDQLFGEGIVFTKMKK